ncbi:IS110 family transposase [Jiangella ureilytica]|uniref:IS110 family transposase n=2 Tax=Jiangella ureilytica TaxID=2530374 RepID=A0A4R4RAH9_9ACTN|nr:IS110 family transposase [Jiangella ureilytica]TDC45202.1 IS110 family transposase [Jiangella ureilytica]
MTHPRPVVFMGVDTHLDIHHLAVVDQLGAPLGDTQVPATPAGSAAAVVFAAGHGEVAAAGVEGTGSYGAGLTRFLTDAGIVVVEVNRPNRAERRLAGKSDPIDAYAAARAAASGRARTVPKDRTGTVEAIRAIHTSRRGAVKARTQAMNQLRALLVTAPAGLREHLRALPTHELVDACARLRPGHDLADPTAATKTALRRLARRIQQLSEEITDADIDLDTLTRQAAPTLRAQPGVGPDAAAKLLITAGDNPHRIGSDAAFAHLCGVAPIPASSGHTTRHRLNRGGDRQANNALHTITLTRQRHDPRTRAYTQRRTTEGLTPRDIRRCLKRYIARELHPILTADLAALTT